MLTLPLPSRRDPPAPLLLWEMAQGVSANDPLPTNVATLEQAQEALRRAGRELAAQRQQIARLESLVPVDALTGLGNKAALLKALGRELSLTRRARKNAGFLILVQLNDPRALADLHGRHTADCFLQQAAAALLNEVRSADTVCHLGEGLFALVMPQTDAKSGASRLARLEKSLTPRAAHIRSLEIAYEARLGFAFIEETETPESLLIAADARLYAQKATRKRD